jgi:hypothetical protein
MFFADRLTLDKPRRSAEGYMGVHAKGARSGTYQYLGREIDPEGKHFASDQVVNVYRAPEQVFDARALGSFIAKPITDDHPQKPVTAQNWRDLAGGTIMGAVQEGEYVGFDLAFLDAAVIDSVDSGKRELSCGYSSEIIIEDGIAPDGTPFHARQVSIRGNHIAIVDKGRAGGTCRIGDAAICEPMPSDEVKQLLSDGQTYRESDANDKKPPTNVVRQSGEIQMPHVLVIDGLQVPNVSDEAKAAIEKLQGQVTAANDAKAKAETDVARLTTDNATLTADKAKLEQQLKDAELTPAKLQDAAKAYAGTVDKAKKLAPSLTLSDEMDEPAIRRAVVAARLGDAAKDWSDDQVSISFDTLAAQAADAKVDPVRGAIASVPAHIADASAVRDLARMSQY